MSYPLFHPGRPGQTPLALSAAEFAVEFPGESHYVEFKQGVPEDKITEAVVAFSNADGGVLFIGVDPKGRVVGIDASGELLARLHRVIARIHNPGRYEVFQVPVDERVVVAIAVQRRHEGFAQTTDGRVLVRRDAQNVVLVGGHLADFLSRRALARFELQPSGFSAGHLDEVLLAELADAWRWGAEGRDDRLVEHGLAVATRDGLELTIAGSLFLLPQPAVDKRKYHIELFRYRDQSDRYDRRVVIDGPLQHQVRAATQLVSDELGVELVVVGVQRYELPRIPTNVLREAIANAVAHRVYEDPRRAVRIEIRPGQVVIVSPGGLPEPVTVQNIREQNSPRNVSVIATLRRMGLAEDAGRGVDVMEDSMAANMLALPRFADDGSSVRVELSTTSTVTGEERAWLLALESRGTVSYAERQVLALAARHGTVGNSLVRDTLGVDSVHARQILQHLRDLGLLRQEGTRGGASYGLEPEFARRHLIPVATTDLIAVVLALAAKGPVANSDVRAATGLDRPKAAALLDSLVADGRLVRVGERRGTHYVLLP